MVASVIMTFIKPTHLILTIVSEVRTVSIRQTPTLYPFDGGQKHKTRNSKTFEKLMSTGKTGSKISLQPRI